MVLNQRILDLNLELNVGFAKKTGHRKSECRDNLNDRMQDNIAALVQTMNLCDERPDDSSQSEDGQNNKEDDNESYTELGFLAMNVADGTDGESNRVENVEGVHIMQRVPVKDSILTVAMLTRRGALLLTNIHTNS